MPKQISITKETVVGVLMGGLSPESKISMKSGQAVSKALKEKGYNVVDIIVDRNLHQKLIEHKVEVAWIALHGIYGEDGCVQGVLELLGIPYTGSGVRACAISMNKNSTKRAIQHRDVQLIKDTRWNSAEPFPNWSAPLVIKDPMGGSSIGVWVCLDQTALESAITECQKLGGIFLVEEYVGGIEITVPIVQGEAFPVITIVPKNAFFDIDAKYTKGQTEYLAPTPGSIIAASSNIPESIAKDAQRQALEAFEELGMRGVARADFIVPCVGKHPNITIAPNTRPVFLEINAIPGMTETSLTPMSASVVGLSFADVTEKILLHAQCDL